MNKTLRYSLFLFLSITSIIFIINFLFTIFEISFHFSAISRILTLILSSIISGSAITMIIISTTPVLKNYLTTFRQLVRLDTLSHPLLLRLQKAAPSTFQHSLQVASLAHRAAGSIGADAFLTRIGAYYHDIGKIKDADFFIENRTKDTPARAVETPRELLRKIQSHVKQGLVLAKEYNLPAEVTAFIPEHHGTLLAVMPYENAKAKGENVKKKDFRYPGPKPHSKETALIMLSDAIESKMRTVENLTEENISEVIDSIINSRLEDKQLEYSGLTTSDIKLIRQAFIDEAQVLYHQRIKYPEKKESKD
jgi:putative nucleotidyltransferase with HDIG domain